MAVGAADMVVDPALSGTENPSGETTGPTLSASMNDVIVSGNSAGGDGGGIWTASPFSATNVVVQNNTSTTNGGGMYNEAATSIVNSTFSGNTAEGGGGMFTTGSNSVTVTGSTFAGIVPLVRNCQVIAEAPLEITVYMTKPRGISVSTNAAHISAVMIWFLVRRQPLGSRRSTAS